MIGRKIIQLECVDSTNNYVAKMILENDIEFGTVILADEQLNGKGQRGSVWHSKSGQNLLFSMYLDSAILSVSNQFDLSKIVTISIVRTLKSYGIEAKIKWPNDVYVHDKKIAGVLIENQISGQNLKSSIIGIGLNLNQTEFEGLNATSLRNEINDFVPVYDFALSLINQFNSCWVMLEQGEVGEINRLYLHDFYLLDQSHSFRDKEGPFLGKIKGVAENGFLILESVERSKVFYDLKEVSFF
jgi:BirA family transcriptional regulator, biotin operon repressor / biotin---[acetyl-CoA-carboxylase] ligase